MNYQVIMSYQKSSSTVKDPWDASRTGWLGIAWYEKFGPQSLAKLQRHFQSTGGESAWHASKNEFLQAGITLSTATSFIDWRATQDPAKFKQILNKYSIDFYLPWDKQYPVALRQSIHPPGALFWRGAPLDTRPWIAVVGTRAMSAYGVHATEIIVRGLVEADAGIVSGLALGIDGKAHDVALQSGGKTVGILACGLDEPSIYPRSNAKLAERILLSGGTLISEFPPFTKALKQHFPQRNRLIAALAKATIVVEAGEKSGSVMTANFAAEDNREVFAVPGPINSLMSKGTNELLRQGAQICASASDVLASAPVKPAIESQPFDHQLTGEERRILEICRTPIHVDDIARLLSFPSAMVSATCMNLELINALQNIGFQQYELTTFGRKLLNQSEVHTQ